MNYVTPESFLQIKPTRNIMMMTAMMMMMMLKDIMLKDNNYKLIITDKIFKRYDNYINDYDDDNNDLTNIII